MNINPFFYEIANQGARDMQFPLSRCVVDDEEMPEPGNQFNLLRISAYH
jgi:hypothetical protein